MPDRRRSLRRITSARSLYRAVTHLVVIGLVAFSAAFGIHAARADAQSAAAAAAETAFRFDLVARARGAAGDVPAQRSVTFDLEPAPQDADPMLSRRQPRVTATPLPTPVAPPSPTPEPKVVAVAPAAPAPPVVGSGSLAWPVPGGTITQGYHGGHRAVDIANSSGSTVVAADAGVVTWAGWRNNGGGLVIVIDHGNGIVTAYNHLGTVWVSPGQAVARGQGIAAVGCTGICTGPHVHFETIVGGVVVNPLRYL